MRHGSFGSSHCSSWRSECVSRLALCSQKICMTQGKGNRECQEDFELVCSFSSCNRELSSSLNSALSACSLTCRPFADLANLPLPRQDAGYKLHCCSLSNCLGLRVVHVTGTGVAPQIPCKQNKSQEYYIIEAQGNRSTLSFAKFRRDGKKKAFTLQRAKEPREAPKPLVRECMQVSMATLTQTQTEVPQPGNE